VYETRLVRVLILAAVYFFIYATLFAYSIITHVDPYDLTRFLQNPWVAPYTVSGWLARNPILILTLFSAVLYSLIYGFATEWVLHTLKRYITLGKERQGT